MLYLLLQPLDLSYLNLLEGRLRVHAHVEGDALAHGRLVLVKDSPLLAPSGIPDTDGVVVGLSLVAGHAQRVPVVRDKEDGVWVAVGQRMVNVSGARKSIRDVLGRSEMDEYGRLYRTGSTQYGLMCINPAEAIVVVVPVSVIDHTADLICRIKHDLA